MFKFFLITFVVLSSVCVKASFMCDLSISDREKLALPANYGCYTRKTIDQHFYKKSLIFHPDKKTLFSSSAAFNCLEEARRRLRIKQCDSVHNTYSTVSVVKIILSFFIGLNCATNIAITMRRGKNLKPYQQH